jgi:PAS domain S-box-containing protein
MIGKTAKNLSTTWRDDDQLQINQLWDEIEARFGICPSFFKLAQCEPLIARNLFRQAEFAYLDSPIPVHFKERLFTWLSRFCEIRYCVARHCAFLLGRGHVAGDAGAQPLSVEQALALLKEPMPAKEDLPEYLSALEETPAPLGDWPDFDSDLGRRLRVACAVVFLTPGQATPWLRELLRLLGPQRYEQLMLFLAFVRTAHFWTEVHPELDFDPDLVTMLREHEALAEQLLHNADEAVHWELGQRLYDEMQRLREIQRSVEALRDSEARFRRVFENAAVGIGRVAPDGRWLEVNQRFCDIVGYPREELLTKTFSDITHPDDLDVDWKQAQRLFAVEIENYSMEKRYFRKDGSIIWANLTRSLARKADGSPDYFITVLEDISERKQAEERRRQSESRLRLASRAAGLGVFEWDVEADRAVWENQRMYDIFGLTRADGALSKALLIERHMHPDDIATFERALADGMKSGRPFHTVYRIRRKDGELRWLELFGNFSLACDGALIRMIGVLADITERKQAEETLRESEERFRILADTAPVMIWSSGTDRLCTFFNKPWLDFTGHAMEEEIGAGWTKGVHPDDYDHCLEIYLTSFEAREPFEMEYRLRRYDGEYRWILDHGVPRFSPGGDFLGYIGSCIDITERRNVEQALRESKERLTGIVSSAMDAIITVDEDQRVVLFNEAAEKMFGCPAAEAMGQPLNRFIPERFRSAHTEHIRRFGKTGGTSRAMGHLRALAALRADGTEFPIEASISKIEVGGRKLYTVIHRDITERKQAEAEREQLAQEQIARAAAEAANRSKDEFLATVSHELRSPLNAILGYTRMLRSGPVDREAINNITATVERSVKVQLQIIEDLLDSARIASGKLRIEPEPVDLVPALQAALDTVRSAAEAKGVTLVANFGPLTEEVLGDATRIQQVVWNLLTNAVKFTPEGGRVELRMEGDADNVRITVSDTGKGIESEFLPFVFDRFRQADPSSARRYGGLGLGLSLVKHLVELHGGTITAESEGARKGSTFTVTLPRRHLELIPPPPAVTLREAHTEDVITKDETLSLEGVSALVVDDQEDARELLVQALSEYGAQVTAVSSGAEALAFLSNLPGGKRPDALILDIAMPEEDGYTTLKKVRALEAAQGAAADQIPAIALTAFGRSEDRLRALQAGFHIHVAKPVEPAELAVIIASLTTRRALERERKE